MSRPHNTIHIGRAAHIIGELENPSETLGSVSPERLVLHIPVALGVLVTERESDMRRIIEHAGMSVEHTHGTPQDERIIELGGVLDESAFLVAHRGITRMAYEEVPTSDVSFLHAAETPLLGPNQALTSA